MSEQETPQQETPEPETPPALLTPPEENQPPVSTRAVTCLTPGCHNYGHTLIYKIYGFLVFCGACGIQIQSIDPQFTQEEIEAVIEYGNQQH